MPRGAAWCNEQPDEVGEGLLLKAGGESKDLKVWNGEGGCRHHKSSPVEFWSGHKVTLGGPSLSSKAGIWLCAALWEGGVQGWGCDQDWGGLIRYVGGPRRGTAGCQGAC